MNETAPTRQQRFAEFFETEISPGLPALEEARKDRRRAAFTRAFGTAFVVVLATLIAWLLAHPLVALVVLAAGAGLGVFWVLRPARQHRGAVRELFLPPLLRFLGDVDYHRAPGWRFDLEGFRRSGVLPGVSQAKAVLEDLIVGRYRDTDYRLVEARLTPKSRTKNKASSSMLFAGLLCDISVPAPFAGKVLLVAAPDEADAQTTAAPGDGHGGLLQVTLDHADFEKRYRVYSDSPRTARSLLQPALLDSLLAIADDLGVSAVNCAFLDGRFLVALPQTRNLFEIGRLSRSLDHAKEDLRQLAAELTIPNRLIDNLHGERKLLLPDS